MVATSILVVDDDRETCISMSDILTDLGYKVDTATDGFAALELSGRSLYRLALLDYKMPGMDGVELYRYLKQAQAETVGVLVTGFAADTTVQEAIRAGFRHVLPKPVDFGQLIPLVEEVAGTP